jgi:hypothetical protein
MDDKTFKKHLKDLAAGHHHPEEHDWSTPTAASKGARKKASRPRAKRK